MSDEKHDAPLPPVRELDDAELGAVAGGDGQPAPMVSNIMKTKHDTVKNSISNVH